jgi:hypothetical protein
LIGALIKSGWKATGLSPVSLAKPLLSPLLLENSQKRKDQLAKSTIQGSKGLRAMSESPLRKGEADWNTPRKARDLQQQLVKFNSQTSPSPAQRRLFRKITKGFDEKDILLANALQRVEALEAQIEAIRPQKRRKVELSPNSKFADIEAIQRAQNKADRNEDISMKREKPNYVVMRRTVL